MWRDVIRAMTCRMSWWSVLGRFWQGLVQDTGVVRCGASRPCTLNEGRDAYHEHFATPVQLFDVSTGL